MARLNILDHALRNGNQTEIETAKALIKAKPELGLFPTRVVTGLLYNGTEKRTRPTASARGMNEGKSSVKSQSVPKQYKLSQWVERSEVDRMYLDTLAPEAAAEERMIQATEIAESITDDFFSEFYYGSVATDANGFDGFGTYASSLNSTVLNNSPICLSASGTGSDLSSIYAVKFGTGGVELLVNSAGVPQFTDLGIQLVSDGSNDFSAYSTDVSWVAGARYATHGIGRIANIEDGSSNTITVSLLSQLTRYMGGIDALFVNPYIAHRLDNLANGSITYYQDDSNLASTVNTVNGIPFFVSDMITQTETAVA